MKFEITPEQRSGFDFLTLKNNDNGESVEILQSMGGTVNRISLCFENEAEDILFHDNDNEIGKNLLFRGRILFPFNDRIPEGKYNFMSNNFQLLQNNPDDGSSIHGLVYNRKFDIVETKISNTACSVQLRYEIKKNRFQGYPFNLEFHILYSLSLHSFDINFTISNKGDIKAPVALGWHPYFTFGNSLSECSLQNDSAQFVEVDDELNPTGDIINSGNTIYDFRHKDLIGNRELDIAITAPENGTTVFSTDKRKIILTQDTGFFKYTQLYIPEDKKSIAIEPVSAATNAFNFPELGLKTIQPGETITAWINVQT